VAPTDRDSAVHLIVFCGARLEHRIHAEIIAGWVDLLTIEEISRFCFAGWIRRVTLNRALREHHDLAAGFVFLHRAVRVHDLFEMEHFADLDAQFAGGDLVKQLLKRHPHKIL